MSASICHNLHVRRNPRTRLKQDFWLDFDLAARRNKCPPFSEVSKTRIRLNCAIPTSKTRSVHVDYSANFHSLLPSVSGASRLCAKPPPICRRERGGRTGNHKQPLVFKPRAFYPSDGHDAQILRRDYSLWSRPETLRHELCPFGLMVWCFRLNFTV